MKKKISIVVLNVLFATFVCTVISNAEIVVLSSNYTEKFLPSSAVSVKGGTEDGIIACWYDEIDNGSLYVQKIGTDGIFYWSIRGKQADVNLGQIYSGEACFPEIFSDGDGGAVILYRKTVGHSEEIYFTKILYRDYC